MLPGLAPGRFGVNGGMRDCAGQPMFLVPDAPVGPPWCTVDGRRVSLGGPRLQQRAQMAPQTPNQRGQPRRQVRKAAFPGAPRGKPPVRRQQGTHLQRDRIGLRQKAEQGLGGIESPNDHDEERLDKERIAIGCLSPALAFGGRPWRGYLLDKPEEADKDAAMGEHGSASGVCGLVTAILRRQPCSGQDLSAALPFLTTSQLAVFSVVIKTRWSTR